MWIKGNFLLVLAKEGRGETAKKGRKEKRERSSENFWYKYMFKNELVILNHPLSLAAPNSSSSIMLMCAQFLRRPPRLAALHCSSRLQYFEMSTLTNIDLKLSIVFAQNTRCVRCRDQCLDNGIFPVLSIECECLDWRGSAAPTSYLPLLGVLCWSIQNIIHEFVWLRHQLLKIMSILALGLV